MYTDTTLIAQYHALATATEPRILLDGQLKLTKLFLGNWVIEVWLVKMPLELSLAAS